MQWKAGLRRVFVVVSIAIGLWITGQVQSVNGPMDLNCTGQLSDAYSEGSIDMEAFKMEAFKQRIMDCRTLGDLSQALLFGLGASVVAFLLMEFFRFIGAWLIRGFQTDINHPICLSYVDSAPLMDDVGSLADFMAGRR